MVIPKVPRHPRAPLSISASDLTAYDAPLWRICRTSGNYVLPWNVGRDYGPLPGQRWDPHVPGAGTQRERSVLYTAGDIATAAAEVWQVSRHIDVHLGRPILVRAQPTRPLGLLDLSRGNWALRAGASASLPHANKQTCRAWSRAILDAKPDLDGLLVPSTMTGRNNIVLFPSGILALPESPDMSRTIDDPAVRTLLAHIAKDIGYSI